MIETLIESLKQNPYFSAGFGLVGVGAGLTVLRQGSVLGLTYLRRQLLVTLEIPSKDKSYPWFLQWMSAQKAYRTQQLAVETSYKQHDNGSVSANFSLVPGPGKHFFKFRGAWFQVQRVRDSKMMDLTSGSPWETITLTTLSRDRKLFPELLSQAREEALSKQEGKTVIYTSWGPEWRPFGHARKRKPLSSVILKQGQTDKIVKDVKSFLSNGEWYNQRGEFKYD